MASTSKQPNLLWNDDIIMHTDDFDNFIDQKTYSDDSYRIWYERNRKGQEMYDMKLYEKGVNLHKINLNFTREIIKDKRIEAEACQNLGACYREITDYNLAILYFERVYTLALELNDYYLEFLSLCELENTHRRNSRQIQNKNKRSTPASTAEYSKSLIYRRNKAKFQDKHNSKFSHSKLAEIYYRCGKFRDSLRIYVNMLNEFGCMESKLIWLELYVKLGNTYFALKKYTSATRIYRMALTTSYKLGSKNLRPLIYFNMYQIGRMYSEWESLLIDKLNIYILACRDIEDDVGLSIGYYHLVKILLTIGNRKEACEYAENLYEIYRKTGDISGMKDTRIIIASFEETRIKPNPAESTKANESLENTTNSKSVASQSQSSSSKLATQADPTNSVKISIAPWHNRNYQANMNHHINDNDNAMRFHLENLDLARSMDDKIFEMKTLTNLGIMYSGAGNHEKAIYCLVQALNFAYEKDIKDILEPIFFNLGKSHVNHARDIIKDSTNYDNQFIQSLLEQATDYFQKTLEIEIANDNIDVTFTYLGDIYYIIGKYNEAIKYYQKTLEIGLQFNQKIRYGLYSSIGNCYIFLQDYTEAKNNYEKALEIAIELNHLKWIAECYSDLAQTFYFDVNLTASLDHYLMYLKAVQIFNDIEGQAKALWNLTCLSSIMRNSNDANEYCKEHMKIAKKLNSDYHIKLASINIRALEQNRMQITEIITVESE